MTELDYTIRGTKFLQASASGLVSACSNAIVVFEDIPTLANSSFSRTDSINSSLYPSTHFYTGPGIVADNLDYSLVSINLKDRFNNNVRHYRATMTATPDTNGTNAYEQCTTSDTNGDLTCKIRSTYVEQKTPRVTTVTKVTGCSGFTVPKLWRLSNLQQ